jgi:hypothetical protein
MKTITSAQVLKDLDSALKEFGRYSFYDKGAHEVMDLRPITRFLKHLTVAEVITFLEALRGTDEQEPRWTLASNLIGAIDDGPWHEEEWELICKVCPDAY